MLSRHNGIVAAAIECWAMTMALYRVAMAL
jgi:hypothetical protein